MMTLSRMIAGRRLVLFLGLVFQLAVHATANLGKIPAALVADRVQGFGTRRRFSFLVLPNDGPDASPTALWLSQRDRLRGGDDGSSASSPSSSEETAYDEDEEYDEADDAILRDSNLEDFEDDGEESDQEIAIVEEAEQEIDDYVEIAEEEIFEDAEEEGPDTVTSIDEDEMELDDEDEEVPQEESPVQLTTNVLERATAAAATAITTTDDEFSSAFVDRMELADAYDPEEEEDAAATASSVDDTTALAAAGAATAVAVGGSDVDLSHEEPGNEEMESGDGVASAVDDLTITDEMAKILVEELKFNPSDVAVLRPDIAAMVVAKNLRKPIEGMPPNWYLPGTSPKATTLRKRLLKASVAIAAVTTLALVGMNGDLDLEMVPQTLVKIPALILGVPKSLLKVVPSGSSTGTGLIASDVIEVEATESVPSEAGAAEEENDDDHPHSVRPGSTSAPAYEDDLDKSILDKIWTKVENVIKAFLRIEI